MMDSTEIDFFPILTVSFQAAWGGGLLFSKKHRHPRLDGIER